MFHVFVVEFDGNIYIFGGYNSKLKKHYNDLYMYNPGNIAGYLKYTISSSTPRTRYVIIQI